MLNNIVKNILDALDAIKGLIAFMTRIPVGHFKSGFEEISKYLTFIVIIGLFIGFIGAICSYPFFYFGINSEVVGVIVLFIMLYIQGFHHVDGLGDYGDAWMVMGNAKRKLEVMKDKYMGVGAFVFIFFIELMSITSINYIYGLFNSNFIMFLKIVVLIESCSRLSLLSCACCGIPSKDGTGRYFAKNNSEYQLFIGYMFVLIVSFLMEIPKIGVLLSTLAVFLGMFIAWVSNKNLKCITGDILGASCEIARAVLYIIILFFI